MTMVSITSGTFGTEYSILYRIAALPSCSSSLYPDGQSDGVISFQFHHLSENLSIGLVGKVV